MLPTTFLLHLYYIPTLLRSYYSSAQEGAQANTRATKTTPHRKREAIPTAGAPMIKAEHIHSPWAHRYQQFTDALPTAGAPMIKAEHIHSPWVHRYQQFTDDELPSGEETLTPTDELNRIMDEQAQIDAEIARLRAEERLIETRQELARLCDWAAWGLLVDAEIESGTFKQQLALERSRSVRKPDVYSGGSQRALDIFFGQVALVFETKPVTYRHDNDKCVYAAGRLAGIPSQEWEEEKQRINEDPTRTFSYDNFKAFLHEHKLPAHIWEGKLGLRIASVRQRNNQSVPELIAYLNKLEIQVDVPYTDRERRNHLFVSIHKHIRRSIVEDNHPWPTRAELERVATSLEYVLVPPEGIYVKNWGLNSSAVPAGRDPGKPATRAKDRTKSTTRNVVTHAIRKRKSQRRHAPTSNPPCLRQHRRPRRGRSHLAVN